MNFTNHATNVLEEQIKKLESEILQNKVDIAEAFIRIENSMNCKDLIPKDLAAVFEDMQNLKNLMSKLKTNEAQIEILTNSRTEIERSRLEGIWS